MTAPKDFSDVLLAALSPTADGPLGPPKDLDDLRERLNVALGVEHLTIPPYLMAMYTIEPGTNLRAASVIRSVVMEEMLHMTLVANLINAVGGNARVAHSTFVSRYTARLPFQGSLRDVPLQHFSTDALHTFCAIERPKSSPGPTASIGEYYDAIRVGLVELVGKHGEDVVFCGNPDRQIGPEDFYNGGGEVGAIVDQDSADEALRTIVEQGEGRDRSVFDGDDERYGEPGEPAHFFRFDELLHGRAYRSTDRPHEPSGEPIDVDWKSVYRIDPAASVAAYRMEPDQAVYERAMAFNETYGELLHLLDRAFNGEPRVTACAVPVMNELRDLASALLHNPHPHPDLAARGCCASPTFEIADEQIERGRIRALARMSTVG